MSFILYGKSGCSYTLAAKNLLKKYNVINDDNIFMDVNNEDIAVNFNITNKQKYMGYNTFPRIFFSSIDIQNDYIFIGGCDDIKFLYDNMLLLKNDLNKLDRVHDYILKTNRDDKILCDLISKIYKSIKKNLLS